LQAFHSFESDEAGSGAAQVVSMIAAVELPAGQWGNVVEILLNLSRNGSEKQKRASFEAIGFLCEELVSTFCFEISTWLGYCFSASFC
jgi:importin subunit beta-1